MSDDRTDGERNDEYRIDEKREACMEALRNAVKQRLKDIRAEACEPDLPIGKEVASIATCTGAIHYVDSLLCDMKDLIELDLCEELDTDEWLSVRKDLKACMEDLRILRWKLGEALKRMDRRMFGGAVCPRCGGRLGDVVDVTGLASCGPMRIRICEMCGHAVEEKEEEE